MKTRLSPLALTYIGPGRVPSTTKLNMIISQGFTSDIITARLGTPPVNSGFFYNRPSAGGALGDHRPGKMRLFTGVIAVPAPLKKASLDVGRAEIFMET